MNGNSLEDLFFSFQQPKQPLKAHLVLRVAESSNPNDEIKINHKYAFFIECNTPEQALKALTVQFHQFLLDAGILPKNTNLTNQQKLAITTYAAKKIARHYW